MQEATNNEIEGQFQHIDVTSFSRRRVELIIDDIFRITSAASGNEYLDDPISRHCVHIANGDAIDIVSQHSHTSLRPPNDHADYWILCSWVYGFLAFLVTRHIGPQKEQHHGIELPNSLNSSMVFACWRFWLQHTAFSRVHLLWRSMILRGMKQAMYLSMD